jgi:hypothetical protein
MEKSEMLWIASKYKKKGYSYEDMLYGDDTYSATKEQKDEISDYMTEYEDIGRIAFYEKYSEYKLY